MTTQDALRRCAVCREPKEAWRYHTDSSQPDGLAEYCKVCVATGRAPRRQVKAAAQAPAVRPAKASKPAPKPKKRKAATPRSRKPAKAKRTTGKSRRNWSALEREFLQLLHPVARMQDIAAALERCKGSTEQLAYKLGLRHGKGRRARVALMHREAVAAAWLKFQAGAELDLAELLNQEATPQEPVRGKSWERWQSELVEKQAERCSVEEIAQAIGKSEEAVRHRLRRRGVEQ